MELGNISLSEFVMDGPFFHDLYVCHKLTYIDPCHAIAIMSTSNISSILQKTKWSSLKLQLAKIQIRMLNAKTMIITLRTKRTR